MFHHPPALQRPALHHSSHASKKRSKDCLKDNVHQYLMNSSLHGLRYVGEDNISLFERIFFLLSFGLVLLLSIYFISNVFEKWSATPVIVTVNPKSTDIKNVPFPAVTICNMNQARRTVVQNFLNNSTRMAYLNNVCNLDDDMDGSVPTNGSNRWTDFREFLIDVSQPCSDMLIECRFGANKWQCMHLFDSILTDEGICCVFNAVDAQYLYRNSSGIDDFDGKDPISPHMGKAMDWTPEGGYAEDINDQTVTPKTALGPGKHMGLYIVLNASVHDYYCSSTNGAGFKLLLHNPIETPNIANYGVALSPGLETRVIILPRFTEASDRLRQIPIQQRQCIFANERRLSYFRTYSAMNCKNECHSRIMDEICGCVVYYMPRIRTDINICSRSDFKCIERVQAIIDLGQNSTLSCHCLPACFEVAYASSLAVSRLGYEGFLLRDLRLRNATPDQLRRKVVCVCLIVCASSNDITIVNIFYTEGGFRSLKKDELIGFTEFLSNTGGLLGLFMGFSTISLVEIVYFLTFRPFCNHKREANKQRPAHQKQKQLRMREDDSLNNRIWYVRASEMYPTVFRRMQAKISYPE